jgi:hypothetical protein
MGSLSMTIWVRAARIVTAFESIWWCCGGAT